MREIEKNLYLRGKNIKTKKIKLEKKRDISLFIGEKLKIWGSH